MFHNHTLFLLFTAGFYLAACSVINEDFEPEPLPIAALSADERSDQNGVDETAVIEIELAGPLDDKKSEISGLAWYQDHLIILPQYPDFNGNGGFLYRFDKSDLEAYLDSDSPKPLRAETIPFSSPDYEQIIDGYEGFEAIAFDGEDLFLTIEADTKEGMRGYLVKGRIASDLSEIVVETLIPPELLPQAKLDSQAYEALLVAGDMLLAIYEANGAGLNLAPRILRFNKDLGEEEALPFPPIEYRITDATDVDENGRFWVSNYYSGSNKFRAANDTLADAFGIGATHQLYEHGERLVELQLTESGVQLSGAAPIQFELPNDEARKWEGVVRFGERGFLVATDKSPETILGFVEKKTP